MARARIPLAALALAGLVVVAPTSAQTVTFDLSAGYQWVDVSGNKDMYKTQVNDKDGFLLGSLSMLVTGDSQHRGLFDRIRIDASDFGASPQSHFRLRARRFGVLDVDVNYFKAKYYSVLPAFANPFLDAGVVPGQHTDDRRLESLDVNVELLPGKVVTPIVGYRWDRWDGPSQTTVHVGEDEFVLRSNLKETTEEYRAGVAFNLGSFRGSVVQGWRSVDSNDDLSLLTSPDAGNGSHPVLGHDITLDAYSRADRTSVYSPSTTGVVTGRIGDRVRIVGSYVNADVDSDGREAELASGDLLSFSLRRFFDGLDTTVRSKASSPYWRGQGRVEVDLPADFELTAGYTKRHRELDGSAVITEMYLDTIDYGGVATGDIANLVNADNALDRDDTLFETRLTARGLGPFRVWGGWGRTTEDLTVTPAAAEIVIPGGQGGSFTRDIDRASAGATFKSHGFDASVEYHSDRAGAAILRTDLIDRDEWRARLGWSDGKYVHVTATSDSIDGSNHKVGSDYAYDLRHWGGEVEVTPIASLALRAGYSDFETDTSIPIRQPQDFTIVDSVYAERGELTEGSVSWRGASFAAEAGYSRFDNRGDQPLTLDRGWARVSFDLTKAIGAAIEFDSHDYTERELRLADYTARRWALLLRWHD
jgi:hypothetical protein